MKKITAVVSLVTLMSIFGFSGCSSTPMASDENTEVPVEAAANSTEFNALAQSEAGAVVDSANPTTTTVADASTAQSYSPPSFSDSAPAAESSSANLGASSAGRAH